MPTPMPVTLRFAPLFLCSPKQFVEELRAQHEINERLDGAAATVTETEASLKKLASAKAGQLATLDQERTEARRRSVIDKRQPNAQRTEPRIVGRARMLPRQEAWPNSTLI
jgi:hypothetical protein